MLAHGNMTFKEASRNITYNELSIWIDSLELIFSIVINKVKHFINNGLYLAL